jgi:hypothetical protein
MAIADGHNSEPETPAVAWMKRASDRQVRILWQAVVTWPVFLFGDDGRGRNHVSKSSATTAHMSTHLCGTMARRL